MLILPISLITYVSDIDIFEMGYYIRLDTGLIQSGTSCAL